MTTAPKHLKAGSECPPLKENQLRLYNMRFCPYAQRTKLVLAAKNIPYEEININLVEKPEWYLKKNAPGQVPAIEWIDSDSKQTRFIPESLIVSNYLEDVYPEKPLQPADPYLKAQQRVLVDRFGSVISAFYKTLKDDPKQGSEDLNQSLAPYEAALTGKFFGGSKPAMVDYMIWPWFERFPVLSIVGYEFNADGKFPKLAAWIQALNADEAVQKIQVPAESAKKYLESYKKGAPDFEIQ